LPESFYERWDGDFELVQIHENNLVTPIERRCGMIWAQLEQAIESTPDHRAVEYHWALRRWASNFLLHFGALHDGTTLWASELDEYAELLELSARPQTGRTIEDKRSIRLLDEKLGKLLDSVGGSQSRSDSVQLSESVLLSGRWVNEKLRPRTLTTKRSGSLSLTIMFSDGERAALAAPLYLWLNLRERGHLDDRCFPQQLLIGAVDARIRAAAKGRYAFENNDVELMIEGHSGDSYAIARFDGDVDVTYEPASVREDGERA
jgi:hypothetical protein